MPPHYAIGIDLGTTNCVLAYVDLRTGEARVLPIRQLQSLSTIAESPLLPSCFYFPTEIELAQARFNPFAPESNDDDTCYVIGALARDRMNAVPGRVIHSAK